MKIHTSGDPTLEKIILLHPMLYSGEGMIDIFDSFKGYHIIAPDLSGHGQGAEEFTRIEKEADRLVDYLEKNNCTRIKLLLGVSVGARAAMEVVKAKEISFEKVILDGVPLYQNAVLLRILTQRILLWQWRKALKSKEYREIEMKKRYGYLGEVMADNFAKMSKKSILHLVKACTTFDFYPYEKKLQERMYFEFGDKDLYGKQWKKIKTAYPSAHITFHKAYNHIEFMIKDKENYLKRIDDIMEKNPKPDEIVDG